MEVLDNIPVKLELEEVLKLLQLHDRNRKIEAIVEELIERRLLAIHLSEQRTSRSSQCNIDNDPYNGETLEVFIDGIGIFINAVTKEKIITPRSK